MTRQQWSVIMAEIAAAVAEGSRRGVARELGLSSPGLDRLLGGSRPLVRTQRKAAAWYLRRLTPPLSPQDRELAIDVLVSHAPPEASERVRAAVEAEMAAMAGMPAPLAARRLQATWERLCAEAWGTA
jgi:hypothetical protein